MRLHSSLSLLITVSLLSSCSIFHKADHEPEQPAYPPPPPGTPGPGGQPQPIPAPIPEAPRPQPKQFKLSPATSALVQQAHTQAKSGAFAPAANTIERALRIEPANPLLWIELGQIRLSENNPAQANGMGHKALALATGDPTAQASAWRLIAESLRQLNRNEEAADADKKANTLSPR